MANKSGIPQCCSWCHFLSLSTSSNRKYDAKQSLDIFLFRKAPWMLTNGHDDLTSEWEAEDKKEGFWKGGDRPLLLSVSIKYTRQSGLCEKCSRHRPESPAMKMQSPRILFRSLAIMVIITSVIWAKAGNIICLLILGFIYIVLYSYSLWYSIVFLDTVGVTATQTDV